MIAGPLGVKTAARVQVSFGGVCFDRDRFEWKLSAKSRKVWPNPLGCRSIYLPVLSRWKVGGATGRRRRNRRATWNRFEIGANLGGEVANYPGNGGQLINGRFRKFGNNKCALWK